MRKLLLVSLVIQSFVGLAFAGDNDSSTAAEPEMLGIHWTREAHKIHEAAAGRTRSSPNMTYHGGKIMPTAVMQTIFWGPSWAN